MSEMAERLATVLAREFPTPETYEAWLVMVNRSYEADARQLLIALAAEGLELCEREPAEPEPLWGDDGPAVGQVITIAGTNTQTRWTGTYWELVR